MIKYCAPIVLLLLTAGVSAQAEDEKKPAPPIIHADDWVSAWKTARESCPDATVLSLYFVDRSGPTLKDAKIFDCVDMKAAGELLVIVMKGPSGAGESVKIVRAGDMVRIEITKAAMDDKQTP